MPGVNNRVIRMSRPVYIQRYEAGNKHGQVWAFCKIMMRDYTKLVYTTSLRYGERPRNWTFFNLNVDIQIKECPVSWHFSIT